MIHTADTADTNIYLSYVVRQRKKLRWAKAAVQGSTRQSVEYTHHSSHFAMASNRTTLVLAAARSSRSMSDLCAQLKADGVYHWATLNKACFESGIDVSSIKGTLMYVQALHQHFHPNELKRVHNVAAVDTPHPSTTPSRIGSVAHRVLTLPIWTYIVRPLLAAIVGIACAIAVGVLLWTNRDHLWACLKPLAWKVLMLCKDTLL